MRLIRIMMACSIAIIGLTASSCKKENYTSRDTSQLVAPPDVPDEPVDPTLVVFDNADVKDGWSTVGGDPVIETSGAREGTGYLKNTIKDGADFMQFMKQLAVPLDSKLTSGNGMFSFWWYISDASIIKNDGFIEITSGGAADQQEYGWPIAKLLPSLKNGWNQVNLNLREAELSGVPNPAALNFFRIFFHTTTASHSDLVTGIDGLVLKAATPFSLDKVDVVTGWSTVGPAAITESGQKEGTGYLKNTIANGADFMQFIKKFDTPVNSTVNRTNGQFKFWWYISDIAALREDGSIEITSGGKEDDHESAWDVTPLLPNLKNGWNEITLDLDKAINTSDGGADLTAINFFRVFFGTKSKDHSDITVGIDDLRFAGK